MNTLMLLIPDTHLARVVDLGTRCGLVFEEPKAPAYRGKVDVAEVHGSPESFALFVEIALQRGILFELSAIG
jgi:hypothetical protein